MSNLIVRPATRDDFAGTTKVFAEAFFGDDLHRWLFPKSSEYPDELRRLSIGRQRLRFVEPGVRCFVAELDGEIVGYAAFKRCGGDSKEWPEEYRTGLGWWDKFEASLVKLELWYADLFLKAIDRPREVLFKSAGFKWREELPAVSPKGYYYCTGLGTAPSHQRKGIATKMMKVGMDAAAAEGLPLVLIASPVGRFLYKRLGFVIIEITKVEGMAETEGPREGVSMLWEPEGTKGNWVVGEEDVVMDGEFAVRRLKTPPAENENQ